MINIAMTVLIFPTTDTFGILTPQQQKETFPLPNRRRGLRSTGAAPLKSYPASDRTAFLEAM